MICQPQKALSFSHENEDTRKRKREQRDDANECLRRVKTSQYNASDESDASAVSPLQQSVEAPHDTEREVASSASQGLPAAAEAQTVSPGDTSRPEAETSKIPITRVSFNRVVRPRVPMEWKAAISRDLKGLIVAAIEKMSYASMEKKGQPSVKCKRKVIDQEDTHVIQFGFNQNAPSLCTESQGAVTLDENREHAFNDAIQEVVDRFVDDHGCVVVWQTQVAPCRSLFQSNRFAPDRTQGIGALDDEKLFAFEGATIHDDEGKAYSVIGVKHENKEYPIIAKDASGSTFRFPLEKMLGTERRGIAPPIDASDVIREGDIFSVHTAQGFSGHPANPAFWQVTTVRQTERKQYVCMRPIARQQVVNPDARTHPCHASETNWMPVKGEFVGPEETALESYNKFSDSRYRHRDAANRKEARYPFFGNFLSDRRPFLIYFDPLMRGESGVSSWEVMTPHYPPPEQPVDPIDHLGRLN